MLGIKVYFDTNVFMDIASGDIDGETYKKLKHCLAHHNINAYYTPLTFNEVVAWINYKNRSSFDKYRKILSIIKDVCDNNIFEYPEHAITHYIWEIPSRHLNAAGDLNKYRDFICLQRSYRALVNTENFRKCRKMNKAYLNHKRKWVKLKNKALIDINPEYKKRKQKGKPYGLLIKKNGMSFLHHYLSKISKISGLMQQSSRAHQSLNQH